MIAAPVRPSARGLRNLLVTLARWIAPTDNPSASVYGTLGVSLVIASEYSAVETYPRLVAAACVAMVLYWLAHGYATLLGERLTHPVPLTRPQVVGAMRHEWSMFRGVAAPVVAILAAWIFGSPLETAATAGIWTAIAVVFVFEVVAGRVRISAGRDCWSAPCWAPSSAAHC